MTFAERALPMLDMGIFVIPLQPKTKDAYWTNWQFMKFPTAEQVVAWSETHPDDNCGGVATPDTVWELDVDSEQLIAEIKRDTGHDMPDTMMVTSGRDGWGGHYYFRQNDYSRARLHNYQIPGVGQWNTLNKYLVSPGSIHPSGRTYISNGRPIVEAPEWLVDYLMSRAGERKTPTRITVTSGDLKADQIYIDDYVRVNKIDAGEWLDYKPPLGGKGLKRHVRCPNEAEHTPGTGSESSTSILIADTHHIDFKCQHGHCNGIFDWGWYRSKAETMPDISSWGTSVKITEAADETVFYEVATPAAPVTSATNADVAAAPAIIKTHAAGEFPMDAMDTRLGAVARSLECPPAWAFYSCLAVFAGQGVPFSGTLPTNLYVNLLARPGRGKSLTADRAISSFIYDSDGERSPTVVDDLISSDNALILALGGKKIKDIGPDDKVPVPILLYQDEGKNLLAKSNIENSGLPFALNMLFYKTSYGKKVGSALMQCHVRLSLLMGLTINRPADFASIYGLSTRDGLYDRGLYVDGPDSWKFRKSWRADPVILRPQALVVLPDSVDDIFEQWVEVDREQRQRMGELAARMAVAITSAEQLKPDTTAHAISPIPGVRGEATPATSVTKDAAEIAIRLMDHQLAMRLLYRPGEAIDTPQARVSEAIMRALDQAPDGVRWRDLEKQNNLVRKFGAGEINRAKRELQSAGLIEFAEEQSGRGLPTVWVRKIGEDDNAVA